MHKYAEFLNDIFKKRGWSEKTIETFLNPDYERDLIDPFLMKDMEKACVKIFETIENKERIVIYADYDADGMPGAIILEDLFRKINFTNYGIYIPSRNAEGYGLNTEAIEQIANEDTRLLITIDLGITAVKAVAQAKVLGIDTIITDHHLPRFDMNQEGDSSLNLPRAFAILNPKTDDYPEKMLCGAGVVYKLLQAFIQKYGEYYGIKKGWEKWSLDMAGLATLSDMVPLLGENRALAFFGLKVLRKSNRPGLKELFKKKNLDQKYLNEDDLAFSIVPKLNAASRMDDPRKAFLLLSAQNKEEAEEIVSHLDLMNTERKNIVTNMMREVNKRLEKDNTKDVILIGNPKWRVGVLGLVAAKVVEKYQKPVFVWGRDENDIIRGSCRSDGSISVVQLMTANEEFFTDFGGHELAGGFVVAEDKIHFLEESLLFSFQKLRDKKEKTEINFDLELNLSAVNLKNWRELEKMAPFGLANPKPVFLFPKVKIEKIRKFGKNGSGEHLEIIFSDKNSSQKAISFFSDYDSFSRKIDKAEEVNLLANFDFSRFRGKEELRLRIVDII